MSSRFDLSTLAYALPAMPLAALAVAAHVYAPRLYAEELGVSLSWIGFVLLASRLWCAVLDPFVGSRSDRSLARSGRRTASFLPASAALAFAAVMLFSPDYRPASASAAVWFALSCAGTFSALSFFAVPYETLGTELPSTYHQRTSLLAYRSGAMLLGTILIAAAPLVAARAVEGSALRQWETIVLVVAALLLAATAVAVNRLRTVPRGGYGFHSERRPALRELLENRPFVVLVAAFSLSSFGAAMPAALVLFYVEDVLGSELGNAFLLIYFLTGVISLPLWVRIASALDKRRAWLLAMGINAGAFLGVFSLHRGDELLYGALVTLSAIGLGGSVALPASLQADVVDLEEARTGQRKEGQMTGVWSVARELSGAFGTALALVAVELSGYRPSDEQHSQGSLFALRALYALVPSVVTLIAVVIARRLNLDSESYQLLRSQISSIREQRGLA